MCPIYILILFSSIWEINLAPLVLAQTGLNIQPPPICAVAENMYRSIPLQNIELYTVFLLTRENVSCNRDNKLQHSRILDQTSARI
jgi:hypothetical protein